MRVKTAIVGLAALAWLSAAPAWAQASRGPTCAAVEFAAVAETLPNSRTVVAQQGGLVRVSKDPILSGRDVTGARAMLDGGETTVLLSFRPEAGQRMQAFTGQHLGARVALIVDGRALNVFTASGPIGGEGLQFSGMTAESGEALAAGVNACAAATAR